MTRETILMRLAESREVLRRMGVRRIGFFGSAARGEEARDLDFLLELDEKTFDAYMDVKLFLEDLFGRPVDLVLADALKPALREGILRETVYAPGF
jgi:predicted nucleotidyltransferase